MAASAASCHENACALRKEPSRPEANPDRLYGVSTSPWFRVWLGCAGAIIVVVSLWEGPAPIVPDAVEGTASLAVVPKAPPPFWQPIARPLAIYAMDAPELKPLPFTFTARRDPIGAREDDLTYGAFGDGSRPYLRIALRRAPASEPAPASLFVDLARHASEAAGLAVMHSAAPVGVGTKFGLVEAADVALAESEERACLAFRFAHQEVGFRMGGWLCPPKDQPTDRHKLACTIDGLTLVDAGNDQQLRALFAQVDRQRTEGCAPQPVASARPPRKDKEPPRVVQERATPKRQPVTAARKGSASPRRAPARAAGSGVPGSRG
jgi:hypothetical protein